MTVRQASGRSGVDCRKGGTDAVWWSVRVALPARGALWDPVGANWT
jgi:hypothetical protein